MALVEHERDAGVLAQAVGADDLVHDPEQLERVGGADHEVVVGVEARVEVEPAEAIRPEQGRDDELDVRPRRVVAGVHDDLRLRPGRHAVDVRRPPVGHVHRVERRLEELVLEEHSLVRAQPCMDRRQRLGQPILAAADVVLAGIVGPVGEPQLQVPGAGHIHDVDAREQVVECLAPHARVGIADAAEHVVVVLEDVGVDRPEADAGVRCVTGQVGVIVDPVPRDVERDARRDAGEPVDLGGVGDLLVGSPRHALLGEHLETGPGVAEGPRRQLDPLVPQRRDDGWVAGHVCLRHPAGRIRPLALSRFDRKRWLPVVSDPAGGP